MSEVPLYILSGVWLRVSGSGFVFLVSGFWFMVSGLWVRIGVLGLGFATRISLRTWHCADGGLGFWFLVSGLWFLVSDFWLLVSGFRFLISNFQFRSDCLRSGCPRGPAREGERERERETEKEKGWSTFFSLTGSYAARFSYLPHKQPVRVRRPSYTTL